MKNRILKALASFGLSVCVLAGSSVVSMAEETPGKTECLPNIVGETTAMATWRFVTPSGAFATASSQPGPDGYANNLGLNVNFYASRCSSVYGNSSTVQPAAYYVYMWRRTA